MAKYSELDNAIYKPDPSSIEAFAPYINKDGVVDFTGGKIPTPFIAAHQHLVRTGEIPYEYDDTNRRTVTITHEEHKRMLFKEFGYDPDSSIKGPIELTPGGRAKAKLEREMSDAKAWKEYFEKERIREEEIIKIREKNEKEMLELITKRSHYNQKLAHLSIKRKKDIPKIAEYNAKVRTITSKLIALEKETGIKVSDLKIEKEGSKLSRFFNSIKEKTVKVYKKVKKFVKKYAEPIISVLALAASFFIPKFLRKYFPQPSVSLLA
jgi:hypothetical protein